MSAISPSALGIKQRSVSLGKGTQKLGIKLIYSILKLNETNKICLIILQAFQIGHRFDVIFSSCNISIDKHKTIN